VVSNPEKRVPGIDVLRGLCIIAVVLHHINLRIRLNHVPIGQLLPQRVHDVLFWNGYYGVRVFFVISGFLIAGWSLKRWGKLEKISLRQFYAMRFARIVPCLLGLLVLLAILDRVGAPRFVINPQRASLPRALLAALTFHVNWLEAAKGYLPAGWDVLWSLSVEEVFYLFFPLLCRWLRKELLLIFLLAGFVIVGPFARTLTHNEIWADYGYLACMDGIALGCLAAIVAAKFRFSDKANLAMRISGAALCIFIMVFRGWQARLGLYKVGLDVTILELGTALLVIAYQQGFEAKATVGHWLTSPLRWFGRNSYEVYLTHMLVVWPMVGIFYHTNQSLNSAPLWFVAMTVFSGLLGYAVARFFSEPVNRALRTKLLPRPRAVAVAAVSQDTSPQRARD
jgi:peptidoglycan/LPS O-acetylase OafA/YrhL